MDDYLEELISSKDEKEDLMVSADDNDDFDLDEALTELFNQHADTMNDNAW